LGLAIQDSITVITSAAALVDLTRVRAFTGVFSMLAWVRLGSGLPVAPGIVTGAERAAPALQSEPRPSIRVQFGCKCRFDPYMFPFHSTLNSLIFLHIVFRPPR
jgi:hypothetical protein